MFTTKMALRQHSGLISNLLLSFCSTANCHGLLPQRAGTKGPAAKRSGFPGPDSIRADVAGATKSKASRGFI
ncbi:unnamed protein product [Gadus morhua 'NCC']